MKPLSAKDSIVPIGEFKTHASRFVRQLREDGRPVIITQNGRAAGVLVSPEDFDRFTERERFVAAVEQGLSQSEAGLGVDDDELLETLDREFGRVGEP